MASYPGCDSVDAPGGLTLLAVGKLAEPASTTSSSRQGDLQLLLLLLLGRAGVDESWKWLFLDSCCSCQEACVWHHLAERRWGLGRRVLG